MTGSSLKAGSELTQRQVSFDVTKADAVRISRIVNRAFDMGLVMRKNRLNLSMSLTACVANGCPLRLDDLLAADDFNFIHDVAGIDRHINHETGQLDNHFLPRFARPAATVVRDPADKQSSSAVADGKRRPEPVR